MGRFISSSQTKNLIQLIQQKKVLIFDFDGVLVDSVEVKTDAFADLYKTHGQSVMDRVVAHHRANGGMTRYEKFHHYQKEFLGSRATDDAIQRLSLEFSKIVVDKVINAPEISGATDFLQACNKEKICCVNSATPEDEIRDIIKQRRWADFFDGVYGAPTTKLENLNKISGSYAGFNKDDFLFFGDALSDLNAANAAGMDFIGIGHIKNSILAGKISEEKLVADFSCLLKG